MNHIFRRILLIDDTDEVLKALAANINTQVSVGGLSAAIKIDTLHITMERPEGKAEYEISRPTMESLGDLCGQKFDYIFSDFTFIADTAANERLRATLLDESRDVRKTDLNKTFLLQLGDIKQKLDGMESPAQITYEHKRLIQESFIEHKGEVLIYTNSPKPFDNYFDHFELPVREQEISAVFKNAKQIHFILLHKEFSITPDIDQYLKTNERKANYTRLLSRRIESLMHRVVLEDMVSSQSKLRFSKTRQALQLLAIVGIGFGGYVAWSGEVFYHFVKSSVLLVLANSPAQLHSDSVMLNVILAVIFFIVPVFVIPILSVLIAKLTEKQLDKLL